MIYLTSLTDDLPPPPEPSEYVSCVSGNSFPPPPEELPPPPSPVSSSYSELRRATYQTDFPSGNYPADIYGPSSQSSSTYESIYEPINPRPPSQLSCNYSMYSGYGSATSTQPQGKVSPVKEVRLFNKNIHIWNVNFCQCILNYQSKIKRMV